MKKPKDLPLIIPPMHILRFPRSIALQLRFHLSERRLRTGPRLVCNVHHLLGRRRCPLDLPH